MNKQINEQNSFSTEEKIGQLVGQASMCWSNIDQAGVFNSQEAKLVVDKLMLIVDDVVEKRNREWESQINDFIPIFKEQGAWEERNKQIMKDLMKIGLRDWSMRHPLIDGTTA